MRDLDVFLPAIAAGDPEAFGQWVAGAEPEIRLSLGTFRETVDTEVVCQETLFRVWQVADRIDVDGRGNSVLRLALRTARNLAIDDLRRQRRAVPEVALQEGLDHEPAVTERPADPFIKEAVRRCVEKLSGKPRLAMDARIEASGGQADRALASRLGMKLNTFLKNVGRARRQTVECLRQRGITLDAAETD